MNTGKGQAAKAPVVKPVKGQAAPAKPVSKRKELREAQRATLGAYCRFDKGSDLFGGDSYKRWMKLGATERDYLDTVMAYTTLTSLHSLEARLEELREEVRAGVGALKGVPGAVTELKLLGKSIDALSQDIAFLADAAQDAGYGRGDEDDDGDGDEPQDDGEEEVDSEGEEDELPPPPPSDDAQDGDGQDDAQDGDGQDDAQDGDGQDAELPSLDSLMGSAPPVVDAEAEEVETPKPEPKKRRR